MKRTILAMFIAILMLSCKKETDNGSTEPPIPTDKLPIVMAHGVLASGDTYEQQILRFISNGYDPRVLYVFDWNTIGFGTSSDVLLDKYIDEVLEKTGASQVILVGHSAGGGLGYGYCSTQKRANKVAKYIHIGSGGITKPAGPGSEGSIPTLNIWSEGDKVAGGSNVEGCTNIELIDKDHYQVATGVEAFAAMYEFIHGVPPATTSITPESDIKLSGRVITFGENQPGSAATVKIFELKSDGYRKNSSPDATIVADNKGYWGSFSAKPDTYYEFEVTPSNPDERKVHYYREPFKRSDKTVYLRIFPPKGSLAYNFLSDLPEDDNQSVNAFFGANQAVVSGRDVLLVNEDTLSTTKFAQDTYTTIAMFFYDTNNNQATDLKSVGLFANSAFLKFADIYFPALTPQTVTYTFNGRQLKCPNWKSGTEGVSVMVFD
ncbi:MAG: hypothetical protein K1X55_07840 [Chitinophagales bacterium]|nr:hypothetical protein [Chitinophagales bacterium]